jgi:iron(II)-dependent oxidoreductase
MTKRQHRWFLIGSVGLVLVLACLVAIARCSIDPPSLATPPSSMAFVPAGEFTMGSLRGNADERPPHAVAFEAFYIDRYEVTNDQYLDFFQSVEGQCKGHVYLDPEASNPDSHIGYRNGRYIVEAGYARHPVTLVSSCGAQSCWQQQGKRLPTEAEWAEATRGLDGRAYPWEDTVDHARLNAGDQVGDTTPVGTYRTGASPYGVCDMAGNVWEWTADWYQAYPASSHRSAFFGEKYRVLRGGSWNHPIGDARTTLRDLAHPARRILDVGFRCAKSP